MNTSPTGTPVIPPAAVPYIAGSLAILGTLSQMLPPWTIAAKIFAFIAMLGGPILGVLSPGLRSAPQA